MKRFDDSDYDKLIFPFYDESAQAYDRIFKWDRQDQYKDWISKFRDPEEQKDVEKLVQEVKVGALRTTAPILMVEE